MIGVLPLRVCNQGHQPCCAFHHYYHHWDEATFSTNHVDLEDLKGPQAVCGKPCYRKCPAGSQWDTSTLYSLLF